MGAVFQAKLHRAAYIKGFEKLARVLLTIGLNEKNFGG